MCGKRLAIHANSFRKFNRRIRPRCAVWSSFVRSSCEQPRDKDEEREREREEEEEEEAGRGEVKGGKQKIESKRKRER